MGILVWLILAFLFFLSLYFVVKAAVRNGIVEARGVRHEASEGVPHVRCPACGATHDFDAVKCPNCGHTGEEG